jgi:hypothetical protein
VSESGVLRRIVVPNRIEVNGGWRKLYNEKSHNLNSLPNIIKMIKQYRMKWEGHAAYMEEIRNTYKILFGKPEEKRPLGKSMLRQEGNIKMDLKELWWDGANLTLQRGHLNSAAVSLLR